jgi:hypothetical protein
MLDRRVQFIEVRSAMQQRASSYPYKLSSNAAPPL